MPAATKYATLFNDGARQIVGFPLIAANQSTVDPERVGALLKRLLAPSQTVGFAMPGATPKARTLAAAIEAQTVRIKAALKDLAEEESCTELCAEDMEQLRGLISMTLDDTVALARNGAAEAMVVARLVELIGPLERWHQQALDISTILAEFKKDLEGSLRTNGLLFCYIVQIGHPDSAKSEAAWRGLVLAAQHLYLVCTQIKNKGFDTPLNDRTDEICDCGAELIESIAVAREYIADAGITACDLDSVVLNDESCPTVADFLDQVEWTLESVIGLTSNGGKFNSALLERRLESACGVAKQLLEGYKNPPKALRRLLGKNKALDLWQIIRAIATRVTQLCGSPNIQGGAPAAPPEASGGGVQQHPEVTARSAPRQRTAPHAAKVEVQTPPFEQETMKENGPDGSKNN